MKKEILDKNHVTRGNIISKIYFEIMYLIISKLINYNDKVVLDFGGGLGFLKKKLTKKGAEVYIYDRVKDLSDVDDYNKIDFNVIIFCQVLMYINEKEVLKIFNELNEKKKKIFVITCFSKQTIINKIFAFFLGHSNPHEDTVLTPEKENYIFKKNFNTRKEIDLFLFKVILSNTRY